MQEFLDKLSYLSSENIDIHQLPNPEKVSPLIREVSLNFTYLSDIIHQHNNSLAHLKFNLEPK